jgi:hypothetical protein
VKRAALLAFLALLWSSSGFAQPPTFEPLRRAEDESEAQLSWEIVLAHYPQGMAGAGFDESGQYFTFVRFSSQWECSISASWRFDRCHKLGMSLLQRTTTIHERHEYATTEWEGTSISKDHSYSGYYEYRMAPGSQFDPRIRISQEFPNGVGLAASASCVLDPVVLAGMIGLLHRQERPFRWADVSLSAGFVANSRVSFTASCGIGVPVHDAGLPSASAGFCARYSLKPGEGLELALRASLHVQGRSTWMGITLSIRGRDP